MEIIKYLNKNNQSNLSNLSNMYANNMILEVNIKGTNLKDNDMDMGNFVIKMVDIIKDNGNLIK
jgi:hypothetical protein